MKSSFLLSLFIHLLLLALLVLGGTGNGQNDKDKQGKGNSEEKHLTPNGDKPKEDSTVEIDIIQAIPKNPNAPKTPECAEGKWYGGIGIVMNFLDNSVDECPEFYPAYKSGIRVGDIILEGQEIRGTPGTQIVLNVRRGSELLTFNITREKICTE